jgi:hypothetical protein
VSAVTSAADDPRPVLCASLSVVGNFAYRGGGEEALAALMELAGGVASDDDDDGEPTWPGLDRIAVWDVADNGCWGCE